MRRFFVLCALAALAIGASDASADQPWSCENIRGARYCEWTEVATDPSEPLFLDKQSLCHSATGDFRVYPCTRAGALLHEWVAPVQEGVSCSPTDDNVTCGSVLLDASFWCFEPIDTGASAYCVEPRD